jgi:cob(I)alamin adenosyltransferase
MENKEVKMDDRIRAAVSVPDHTESVRPAMVVDDEQKGPPAQTGKAKMSGLVQVYTGNGKGKTAASLGLALRASGYGLRTYIGQFLKHQPGGEGRALIGSRYITVEQLGNPMPSREWRSSEGYANQVAQAESGLARALGAMCSGDYDIVILDEANTAVWLGMLALSDLLEFLEKRPPNVEVIVTGREARPELLERSDLVTEMRDVKHYYRNGIIARQGFEF